MQINQSSESFLYKVDKLTFNVSAAFSLSPPVLLRICSIYSRSFCLRKDFIRKTIPIGYFANGDFTLSGLQVGVLTGGIEAGAVLHGVQVVMTYDDGAGVALMKFFE